MEVHAHTHTPRKKWTHYLWEFIMLFLAVFCGFLAENQREHFVEHQREKQFMKSYLADLKNDTANFARSIKVFQVTVNTFDSLKSRVKDPVSQQQILNAYKIALITQNFSSFNYSDRTIEQLRNAGDFRLIRNTMVSDSLIEYDRYIRHTYLGLENILSQQLLKLMDLQAAIFDFDIYNYLSEKKRQQSPMLTADSIPYPIKQDAIDKRQFDVFYNALGYYRNFCLRMVRHSEYAKATAEKLMKLIIKEYHPE
jgi:hypothetical protein